VSHQPPTPHSILSPATSSSSTSHRTSTCPPAPPSPASQNPTAPSSSQYSTTASDFHPQNTSGGSRPPAFPSPAATSAASRCQRPSDRPRTTSSPRRSSAWSRSSHSHLPTPRSGNWCTQPSRSLAPAAVWSCASSTRGGCSAAKPGASSSRALGQKRTNSTRG